MPMHEETGRFDIQLLTDVLANFDAFLATIGTGARIRFVPVFDARQVLGQRATSGVPAGGLGRSGWRNGGSHVLGELIELGGVPLRLTTTSPLRGAIRPPGQARGVELLPDAEFRFPVGSRSMRPGSALAPGAFQ